MKSNLYSPFRKGAKSCLVFLLLLAALPGAYGQQPWTWQPNKGKQLSILLFGDTNLQNRKDPGEAFRHVLPTLRQADVRIVNLEGPFAGTSQDPRLPDVPHKENWKHSQMVPEKGLVHAGIDIVGVANNVTYPWMALMRSIQVLRENNIRYAGGGENLKEAHAPVIMEKTV